MFDTELLRLSMELNQKILNTRTKEISIATAESCTGGMLAAAITAIPSSSVYYKQGFITYSNESKIELLGVKPDILKRYGAVSNENSKAMAKGCLIATKSTIAVSITGIAGPDGGSKTKPVGLVYIGLSILHHNIATTSKQHIFSGNRHDIRVKSCMKAIEMILDNIHT